ncbi:MAG: hypothetical protein NT154_02440, partial [Verrucomicrobia bacterium]|nr:hypothetical protein [Verrucomicrobiota bacterium]
MSGESPTNFLVEENWFFQASRGRCDLPQYWTTCTRTTRTAVVHAVRFVGSSGTNRDLPLFSTLTGIQSVNITILRSIQSAAGDPP